MTLCGMFGRNALPSKWTLPVIKKGSDTARDYELQRALSGRRKKVEKITFGIRKRLLEYDDIKNKQRTVIYAKRSHAFVRRASGVDLDNTFYGCCRRPVNTFKEGRFWRFQVWSNRELWHGYKDHRGKFNKDSESNLARKIIRRGVSKLSK